MNAPDNGMLFTSGNVHQPMTVAEVVVRETHLFGTKQEGDSLRLQALADAASTVFQPMEWLVPFTAAQGCSSDNKRAIGNGVGYALVLFCMLEHRGGTHSRAGFAKGQCVRVYDSQAEEPEVTHGAGSGPEVERVPRSHQDDAQVVGFRRPKQDENILRRAGGWRARN